MTLQHPDAPPDAGVCALAEERYELPVYPVLVTIFQPGESVVIVERYVREFLGLQARRDYRVVKLWEVDVEVVVS